MDRELLTGPNPRNSPTPFTTATPQREPTIRSRHPRGFKKCHIGVDFWVLLAHKKSNVEAINAQSTGKMIDDELACDNCAKGDGLFDGCVRVPGQMHCANCHFGDRAQRCSFLNAFSPTNLAQAIAQRDALR